MVECPSKTITAANFSQLYSSLETLEVRRIVSTLLEISPIRDEIRRRVNAMGAVGSTRRRRTNFLTSSSSTSRRLSAKDQKSVTITKKSRKGTPMKLRQPYPYGSGSIKSESSAFTTLKKQGGNEVQRTPDGTANEQQVTGRTDHNAMANVTNLGELASNPYENTATMLYWNSLYRLATQQLINKSITAYLEPATDLTRPSPIPQQSFTQAAHSQSMGYRSPQDVQYTSQMHSPSSTNERIDHRVEQEATQVSCPDCETVVLLTGLHQHLKSECPKRSIAYKQISNVNSAMVKQKISGSDEIQPAGIAGEPDVSSVTRPFTCEICDESFKNKSLLKRHKITHSASGGFPCGVCGKVFARPELLKRHEILHTGMTRNPWPCPTCSRGFSNKYNLAVHERIHTGELPFQCPECPMKFRVKCSMQNHIRSKHNSTVRCDTDSDHSDHTSHTANEDDSADAPALDDTC